MKIRAAFQDRSAEISAIKYLFQEHKAVVEEGFAAFPCRLHSPLISLS